MLAAYLPFVVLGLCAAPWLISLSKRFGLALAVGAVLAGELIVVMLALFASSALQLSPLTTVMVVAALGGLGGVAVLTRTPGALRRPHAATMARWVPASIGAIAWIVVVAVAPAIAGSAPLSWAMNGDTANNIHVARYFLESDGLTARYSVPLNQVPLMLAMAPGRDAATDSLLEHDLTAFTVTWTLELALSAVLLGLVASSLVASNRRALAAVASAAGSLLITTWFVAGLPLEFGYLNAHLALPFLLASWLAFLQSSKHPVAALAVALGLGVLLVTTWTPLVVVTVGLVVAILLRQRALLRVLRGRRLTIVTVSAALFVLPLALFAIPHLAAGMATLALPGHGMPVTVWLLLPLLGGSMASAMLLRHRSSLPLVDGVIGIAAGCIVGIGALLFISINSPDPWSNYYPAKLAWLLTATLVAVAMSFGFRLIDEYVPRHQAVVGAAVLATTAVVLCSLGPAPTRQNFVIAQPLAKIVTGSVWNTGDAAVAKILAHTSEDRRDLLWHTGDPDEAMINFWILEFSGGDTSGDPQLRAFSVSGYRELRDTGSYEVPDLDVLCLVVSRLAPPVYVHTADPGLAAALATACPGATAHVTIDH